MKQTKDYTEHRKTLADGILEVRKGTLVTAVVVGKNTGRTTVYYRKYGSGPVLKALEQDDGGDSGGDLKAAVKRVIAERDEVQTRLSKLCAFMDDRFEGCKFSRLSPGNRVLLERQRAVMQEYRDILDVRIELMAGEVPE